MRVWAANLGRGVTAATFERELVRLLAAAGPRAFLFLQEIDEADAPEEHRILSRLTRDTHTIVGGQTAVPILVPRDVPIVKSNVTLASRGLAKVTPHRVVTECTIRLPGVRATLLNTHLPLARPSTVTRRAQVRATLRRRATTARERDEAVVWAADTNTRTRFPRMAPGEVNVINAGIDKIRAAAPRGRRVVVADRRTLELHIDRHNGHGARVWFAKKGN